MSNNNWSFADNFSWGNNYPQCEAINQSPINIDTDKLEKCEAMCDIKLHYKPSKCFLNFVNNLVTIKYSSGSYVEYKNLLYELKDITIHVPTLHSIDNSKYDLEVCLIHELSTSADKSDTPNGFILSILFSQGDNFGLPSQFFNQIVNDIPRESLNSEKQVNVSSDWNVSMLLPENKSFYIYDGSKPFPPCDTNYKIVVYRDIGTIGRSILEMLQANIGENVRDIQPTDGRHIMYNVDYGEQETKEYYLDKDNQKVIEDKFLRCVKSPLFEIRDDEQETVPTENIDVGLTDNTRKRFKTLFLIAVGLVLLMLSVTAVKYLFKKGFINTFQRLLINRSGNNFSTNNI